jgi:hypothetical protein
MIDLIPYLLILLTIAAIGLYFVIRVIVKQVQLFKQPISDPNVRHFRRVLFAISVAIVITALIPIGINIVSLFFDTGRVSKVPPVSFIYSLNVHLGSLLLSYLLWRIYKIASDSFNDRES